MRARAAALLLVGRDDFAVLVQTLVREALELFEVGEVAVVAQRDGSVARGSQGGLGVFPGVRAGC